MDLHNFIILSIPQCCKSDELAKISLYQNFIISKIIYPRYTEMLPMLSRPASNIVNCYVYLTFVFDI